MKLGELNKLLFFQNKQEARLNEHSIAHTLENSKKLTLHTPLYPPGRIIHIGKEDSESKK